MVKYHNIITGLETRAVRVLKVREQAFEGEALNCEH